MKEAYDLLVIGAGSAGLTAANLATQLGARVALLEKYRIGGDCTWTGCVPSKALLKVAKVAHHMRNADFYGLTKIEPNVDFKSVMARVQKVIADVYQYEMPELLRAEGIDVFVGASHFIDANTLVVGDAVVKARKVLLTTGAHPFVPPIVGIDALNYLTYENIWDLEELPGRLLVLGAGPIGCEMAQAFRRLGSTVTLVEGEERVLPREEPDASRALAKVLISEGVELRLNSKVDATGQADDGIHLYIGSDELIGDALLVAIGRRPNVDGLDLERAGVIYSAKGIKVDNHLQTSQKHIYAAGDCTGGYQFTHYAGWQASMAVRNALLPWKSKGVTDLVPWTTFTDPEVAHVGLTEEKARIKFGGSVMACVWPMEKVDRAQAEGDTAGFLKLIHKRDGTLLGVTAVAERAGEAIHEWVVALERGIKVGDLATVIHIYPTYSMANMQAAAAIRVAQLLRGITGRIIQILIRLKL